MPKQEPRPTQITEREDHQFVLMKGGRKVEEQDQKVEQLGQVEELVASPPPAPPLSSAHADTVEQDEQRQQFGKVEQLRQVKEPTASPSPAPPLSSPHAEAVEQEEQRQELIMVEHEQQQQRQQQPAPPSLPSSLQQQSAPPPPLQKQLQLSGISPPTPWPPPSLQESSAGMGALIARSNPHGKWWFGVGCDREEHDNEEPCKRAGIRTGYLFSIFVGLGKEHGRKRR